MFTIFEKLGGVNEAFDAIQRRTGKRPTPRALKHWRFVKTLPYPITVELTEECLARGIPFSPDDFHLPGFEGRRRAS